MICDTNFLSELYDDTRRMREAGLARLNGDFQGRIMLDPVALGLIEVFVGDGHVIESYNGLILKLILARIGADGRG